MTSTHIGYLPIPQLPKEARIAHLFPALQDTCLISLGLLCDHGCQAHFSSDTVVITHNQKIILHGKRDETTRGLWHLELPLPQLALHAVNHSAKPHELVAFAHAALFSPANSTLLRALQKGYLPPFPGLSVKTLRKHPPKSDATVKGHLDSVRKNLKSTKQPQEKTPTELTQAIEQLLDDAFPTQPIDNDRSHYVYLNISETRGLVHSDLTGRFPVPSSKGYHYLLVVYDYDSNAILMEPLRNRQAKSILDAYQRIHTKLVRGGCKPKLQRLDNEISKIFKDFLKDQDIQYQLVAPHDHRQNAAERAIRTAKNHCIAGWCSTDDDFPMHLWAHTIEHAELSLNLLRGSRINPKLSAWEQINGRFDFNRTPIAPPGIRILAHEKPNQHGTWEAHAQDGWYLGPALEAYRCHKVYITSTRGERTINTISWFPQKTAMPIATPHDLLRAAIADLKAAITSPEPGLLIGTLTPTEVQALQDLTDLLTNKNNTAAQKLNNEDCTIVQPLDPVKRVRFTAETQLHTKCTLRSHTKFPPANTTNDEEHTSTEPTAPAQPLRVEPTPNIIPDDTPVATPTPDSPPAQRLRVRPTPAVVTPPRRKSPRRTAKHKHYAHFAATDTAIVEATKLLDDPKEELYVPHVPAHFAFKAVNPDTGLEAEYIELTKSSDGNYWIRGMCHEIGRLFQGYKDIKGTNTCRFIHRHEMPKDRKATYARVVVADRPRKSEPRRVRVTVGGDQVDYPGEVTTKTTSIITAKCLFNKVISTPDARFMCIDIKDFYLNNDLPRTEYMRFPRHIIPDEIMDLYNLHDMVYNGYVYVAIDKGMYGLPQAGRVASDALIPRLKKQGYTETGIIPGLFKHRKSPLIFCLTVDDFGVSYVGKPVAQHLIDTLSEHYTITTDWEGKNYCGLDLDWHYDEGYVDTSMNGYVKKALQRFEHLPPARLQHAPSAWTAPKYGEKVQYAAKEDDSPPLDKKEVKRLQEIIGTLLFYARAVDSTMLVALGSLASAQSQGTQATMRAAVHLLNYAASHPEAVVRYRASEMILHIHSDASYLSESKARSRSGGYFFLDGKDNPDPDSPPPKPNGAIHVDARILRPVMASAAEAETGALFSNGQEGAYIRTILAEMGHPQPGPTPIQTDNTVANGIANDTVKIKRTKAMDMRFYWIRDRTRQGQFRVHWKRGKNNLADYFTKHHPPSHHIEVRPTYLQTAKLARKSEPECEGVLIPTRDS